MRKTFAMVTVLLAAGLAFAAAGTNQKVIPQTPVTVACDTDPTGGPTYTPGPTVVRYDVWNAATATGVCVTFRPSTGCAQTSDQSSPVTCNFVLGPYAGGVTTPDIWTVGATLDAEINRGVAAFECDTSAGTATLVITEWKRVR